MKRVSTFQTWASARNIRQQIRQQFQEALDAGIVRCANCNRKFSFFEEYTHNERGKPVCFPDCGGDHDRVA
jgi:formylmethanofuran dehydrogenase subunit E